MLLDGGIGREALIAWTRYWQGLTLPAYVLILELANNIDMILTCIEVGASGYTLLGNSAAEIAHAIQQVHDGVGYSSPAITAQLFARVAALRLKVARPIVPSLTPRELEVLRAIAQGYSNREIASTLVIELRTVKQHVHNILGKLNLHSRGDAVRFAFEQGWLNPSPTSSSALD